jgi:hypothetical protein
MVVAEQRKVGLDRQQEIHQDDSSQAYIRQRLEIRNVAFFCPDELFQLLPPLSASQLAGFIKYRALSVNRRSRV